MSGVALRRGGLVLIGLLLVLGVWALATPTMPVSAAGTTYTVTTTDDTPTDANCIVASCTLRQAVNASNGHDPGAGNQNTITFAVSGTITLTNDGTHGTLTLGTSVTIGGPTSGVGVTVSGGGTVLVFAVNSGVTASMSHLTIANGGNATNGGGILNNNGGTLSVTNSTVSGNSATNGGGIFNNAGTLTVTNSTLSGNSANFGFGGGIINNGGTTTVTNSTISGNSASNGGGGIYRNVGTLNLTNTIVSGNGGGDVSGTLATNNHNLVGGTPLLGPLANNGGTTQTFALLAGSPAIGAGDATVCANTAGTAPVAGLDQRGFPRPVATCAIGAFEPQTYTVGSTSDTGAAGTFGECETVANTTCRLRDALGYATGGSDTITFNGTGRGTITVGSVLTLGTSVTIAGPTSGAGVTVSGGGTVQVFIVNSGVTASISNLTIANGNASIGGGVGNSGTLSVTNSTFSGNSAGSNGGGIVNNGTTLTVTNSTFSSNSAINGGGIFNNSGTATVTNSTFSDNSASFLGGGLINNGGTLTVTNSTISGNSAPGGNGGGGIFRHVGTVNLTNSIVSGNTGSDVSGTLAIDSHNLIGGTPLLGPLANNGGATQTIPLLPGSPAIDAGDPAVCASTTLPAGAAVSGKDQRGVTRPAACDIGAFESQGFTMTKGTGDNQATSVSTAFPNPLTLTVSSANSEPVQGGQVTFAGPGVGASIAGSPVLASIGAAGAVSQTVTANAMPGGPYMVNVTASGVATGTSFSLTNVGPATHFTVSVPGSATAGTTFSFTVTALDAANNTATGYSGTVTFTSTDGQVAGGSGLPADYTFIAGDNGVHTFSATLKTAGNQTITATDTVTSSITGTSNSIVVSAGAATHFAVSAPGSATAGTAFSFTVTALDASNNIGTGYSGIVHFTSTDAQATSGSGLPADYTFIAGDAGTHSFSGTLKTAGNQTITATDTVTPATTGTSGTITVSTGATASLVVAGPATTHAGQPYTVTVTAKDGANNTKTDYTGTVKMTTSDPVGRVAPQHTYGAADNGVASFTLLLNTDGVMTVTATDVATPAVTGSTTTTVSGPAIYSVTQSTYGVTPISGPTTGGTTLTIMGNGFTGTTSITVGGVTCTSIAVNPAGTQVTCATGGHGAATVDVTVTTPNGTVTATGAYSYVPPGGAPPPGARPGPVGSGGPPAPAPPSGTGPSAPGVPVNVPPIPRP